MRVRHKQGALSLEMTRDREMTYAVFGSEDV